MSLPIGLFDVLLSFISDFKFERLVNDMATATVALPPSIVEFRSPAQAPLRSESSFNYSNKGNSPTHFVLPDLISHCKFPLARHPDADEVTEASTQWLVDGCPDLTPRHKAALRGIQAGVLTAYCYPWCTAERLRVVADFLGYLFHLDNISDGMMTKETDVLADVVMNAHWFPDRYMPCTKLAGKEQPGEEIGAGKLARDYWSRCIKDAGPRVQARFLETLEEFFESVYLQAKTRDAGIIPDLESYIDVRRDTSGCKSAFDLIEYSMGLDLPDYVHEHPIIEALKQGSNDLVTWSNDIFSYNVEQSRGDDFNMIVIFMIHHNMTLQEAFDEAGELCRRTMDTFSENLKLVPSFGSEQLDKDVQAYIRGLQDWIVGSLHWSFLTERYFGKDGDLVKKTRIVKLLDRRPESA